MKTVSASGGIGAPVKMRAVWPALIGACAKAAGLDAAVERECPFRAFRKVGVAHGVTIDGGVGERRQRQRRRDIAREHAPIGIDERHGLDIGDRVDARR